MAYQNRRLLHVDNWLNRKGYYRKVIPHDGSCLFRAVSEQVYMTQVYHEYVRLECVNYAKGSANEFRECSESDWDNYLNNLRSSLVAGGVQEMRILSRAFKRDFIVFDSTNYTITNLTRNGFKHNILLCSLNEEHYDSVYTLHTTNITGFCQSLVYKLLYGDVYQIESVEEIARNMLSANAPRTLCPSKQHAETAMGDQHTHEFPTLFPYKVAKALDPNQYRNIDYDVWSQYKKDARMSSWYMGGCDLKVGTKCLVRTELGVLECYIQGMFESGRRCDVYLVKEASRRVVSRSDLEPLPDAQPWPSPYWLHKPGRARTADQRESKRNPCRNMEGRRAPVVQEVVAVPQPEPEPEPEAETQAEREPEEDIDVGMEIVNVSVTTRETALISSPTFAEVASGVPPDNYGPPALGVQPAFVQEPGYALGYVQPAYAASYMAYPPDQPPLSLMPNGYDLPLHDLCMLRYYYNVGVQYLHGRGGYLGCAWPVEYSPAVPAAFYAGATPPFTQVPHVQMAQLPQSGQLAFTSPPNTELKYVKTLYQETIAVNNNYRFNSCQGPTANNTASYQPPPAAYLDENLVTSTPTTSSASPPAVVVARRRTPAPDAPRQATPPNPAATVPEPMPPQTQN